MKSKHLLLLLFAFTKPVLGVGFDICKDTVIDDINEKAYGAHGVLYSGEIICFRDKEKITLKYKRYFENGKPIGRHICYDKKGIPYSSIQYDHTSIRKTSVNKKAFLSNSNFKLDANSKQLLLKNCPENSDGMLE